MSAGIETIVIKFITPILLEIAKAASGTVKASIDNWRDTNYASKLARKLVITDRVKTLWSPDRETSLLQIYFPSTVSVHGGTRKTIDSLKDLPVGNIVIEGIVGHGKSVFLRYLCLQEMTGKGTGTLPLFLELRTLGTRVGLQEKIGEALDKLDIKNTPETFDFLAKSGRLSIFLDGFDELDENLTSETISHIEFLIEKYSDLRIIITSRPSNEIQKSRHVKVVNLCGLRRTDYAEFMRRLGLNPAKIHDINNAIDQSPKDVLSIITTPLMLTLLVLVYESEREIPSQLPEFFEKLFSTMFTRHDRLKAGFNRKHFSGLSESRLQKLFESFCFVSMRNRNGRTLNYDQFSKNFEKAKEVMKELECTETNFKEDIIKVSCLMLEEGFDSINFLHKSIPEFFAASFVKRAPEQTAKKFYEQSIKDHDFWSTTLSFLKNIDSYRYEKYYNIIRHEQFLSALGTSINKVATLDEWLQFFNVHLDRFCVGYSTSFSLDNSDDLSATSWGPFETRIPWGGELQGRLVNKLMREIERALPAAISRMVMREESKKYIPVVGDGNVEYSVRLKNILADLDLTEIYRNLQIFEREIWNNLEAAYLVVEGEDKKISLLDDEVI